MMNHLLAVIVLPDPILLCYSMPTYTAIVFTYNETIYCRTSAFKMAISLLMEANQGS